MTESGITIRFATAGDAPDIARIHADSWRRNYRGMYSDRYLDGDLYTDRLAAWTDRVSRDERRYFTLVAERPVADAIGFAHVALDADARWGALVDNLHVSRAAQRIGIGSLLLDRVARLVLERRPDSGIYLWVLEQNEAGQAFYVARKGVLRDTELAAPPGKDPRNLYGQPRRIRVAWSDPSALLLHERP
jgi:ribosomal protein S18 acetylase RimI-like enzyme